MVMASLKEIVYESLEFSYEDKELLKGNFYM